MAPSGEGSVIDRLTTRGGEEKQSRAVDGLFCAALDHLHLKDREWPHRTAGVAASAATSYCEIAVALRINPHFKGERENSKK